MQRTVCDLYNALSLVSLCNLVVCLLTRKSNAKCSRTPGVCSGVVCIPSPTSRPVTSRRRYARRRSPSFALTSYLSFLCSSIPLLPLLRNGPFVPISRLIYVTRAPCQGSMKTLTSRMAPTTATAPTMDITAARPRVMPPLFPCRAYTANQDECVQGHSCFFDSYRFMLGSLGIRRHISQQALGEVHFEPCAGLSACRRANRTSSQLSTECCLFLPGGSSAPNQPRTYDDEYGGR